MLDLYQNLRAARRLPGKRQLAYFAASFTTVFMLRKVADSFSTRSNFAFEKVDALCLLAHSQ